ncbi:MAG TPA: baseplate J/gp47 family protein [Polaromonas sp.]|uniref:baseplate J/gp47 family protein n=1 Tax=Polaromonas sp. TaxID=1869339 RepID=UPI002D36F84A|nr:baseplate J/gp47 family protein [Polaromonas sp.]HYW57669.1 baseplate J/gp47 family protein [Polaromonas sp.]
MPLIRKTLGQLTSQSEAEINALVPGADARLRFSVLRVFARVWAGLVDGLYSALIFLSRQIFGMTATGEYLRLIAASYGIYRLPATAAQGCILLTGAAGTSVPAGSIFQRGDGIQYQTTAGVILPAAGFAEVQAIALTVGEIGNADAAVALTAVVTVAGLTSAAVCTAAIAGGADEEGDEALRIRYLDRLRVPPGPGTVADWVSWAKSFSSEVTRVWVIPAMSGNGTVGLVFAQDNVAIVPPPSAVAAMQAYLDANYTPAGIILTVFAPTLVPVPFTIHELPNADPTIRANIGAELADLLYREGGPGNTIPLSRIREAISSAEGEYDHVLTVPAAPLTFTAVNPVFQLGQLGAITWV